MRNNVPPHAAPVIHRLGIQLGKTDQEVCNLALGLGLKELGAVVPIPPVDDDPRGDVKLTIVLPGSPYAAVGRLARREGCSKSSKIRDVIMVGLKSLGEWPGDTDGTVPADAD